MEFIDVSINEIKKMMESGTRIVFFGAGRALKTFLHETEYMGWNGNAAFVADNDKSKWGMNLDFDNVHLNVESFDMVMDRECGDVLIIIIPDYVAYEIYKKLKKYDKRDNVRGVYKGFVFDKTLEEGLSKGDYSFEIPQENYEIPKILHYFWFGKNKLPDKCKEWMKSWKKYCPDYEIVEWNEDNYDVHQCEYMSEVYDAKVWGFMADYPRLDIMYKYGGIYLDVDVEVLQPLDPLRHQQAFASYQHIAGVNFGNGFGSVPCNELFRRMRDYYKGFHFDNYHRHSCIYYQTPLLKEEGLQDNGKFQRLKSINIYPMTLAFSQYTFRRLNLPNDRSCQFMQHHSMNSHVSAQYRLDKIRYDKFYAEMLGGKMNV